MKKISFLIITFAFTLSLGLFPQESEGLKSDEEIINEVIADKNIDYILDIDSLFEDEDRPLETPPAPTLSQPTPPQPTTAPQTVLPQPSPQTTTIPQTTPSQIILPSQSPTPQATTPNQGNRVIFNIENFFYKSNSTTNVFSTFNQNENSNEKNDVTNQNPKNEVFIIIKKENGNENTVLTNRSEILIESPPVNAPATTPTDTVKPVVKDDAFLAIELIRIVNLVKNRNYESALKKLSQLKETFPKNTRIWNIEGSIYYKLKFYEFALKTWEKSLAIDPNQPLVERFVDRLEAIN